MGTKGRPTRWIGPDHKWFGPIPRDPAWCRATESHSYRRKGRKQAIGNSSEARAASCDELLNTLDLSNNVVYSTRVPRHIPVPLGEFEQLVLLAVLCAGDEAYGLSVYTELTKRTRRPVARGAVYMTLDRLEKKGLLRSSQSAPLPTRGGRARRYYEVTPSALSALKAARQTLVRLWEALDAID